MPEKQNDRVVFSLSEVTASIRQTIAGRYASSFWVKAEMNRLNRYPHSGHCYPELLERSDGKIVAEMRGNLWRDDYESVNAKFLEVLNEPLHDGIAILLQARVSFHPLYGLSLQISDIDPSYTLGELEREKQLAIRTLIREGIFKSNKSLSLPLLPQRIAVISVQTSKGYADFTKILRDNPWGYSFFIMLFPALLQGDQAVDSIRYQLDRIGKVRRHFDAVAIIRGGGGDIGLTCYNHLDLVRQIALFPMPVLTGIGHSTNETVAEMVSHTNAITPTELADFLIQTFHNFSVPLTRAAEAVLSEAGAVIKKAGQDSLQLAHRFRIATSSLMRKGHNDLDTVQSRMTYSAGLRIQHERSTLEHMERITLVLDPSALLKRGYTLTLTGQRILRSIGEVAPGDELITQFADGELTSIVKSIKPKKNG